MRKLLSKAFNSRVRIFQAVVVLFVVICMIQIYDILETGSTQYKYRDLSIKRVPNLEIHPIVNASLRTVFIKYDENEIDTIDRWVYLLDNFLEAYNVEHIGPYTKLASTCDFKHPPPEGQTCPIDIKNFGPCSPPYYGFYSFSPCVYLRLNQVYNWIPECYNNSKSLPSAMPEDLVKHIESAELRKESNQVWVSCSGKHDVDKEHIQKFNYYPSRGFPSYFYPITFRSGRYFSPLIAVKIVNPKPGVFINIECRVWAKNIEYRGGTPKARRGSVEFLIMRDVLESQEYEDETSSRVDGN